MYPLGEFRNRKQTHLNTQVPAEYVLLNSEPAEFEIAPAKHMPRFSYINRYITKRHVMRTIRRLRHEQLQ